MFKLISKPLILMLLAAANLVVVNRSVVSKEIPKPEDGVCYAYYLKMRDMELGTSEYIVNRNKILEARCGAFHRKSAEPEK